MTTGFSETRRQVVHMAVGGFALLLRFLTWWQAALIALAALVFNATLLPRLGGRALYRPTDVARGLPIGILLYPLAVLLLILAFPHRLDIAAAAWGILAFGDGAATLVGRSVGGRPLPWNRHKTVSGTTAFVAAGSAAGIVLAWWVRPAIDPVPALTFTLLAPLVAGVAAGLVETIPVRLDDNLSIPATAGVVLWGLSLMSHEAWAASWPGMLEAFAPAIAINTIVAWAGWRAHTVSRSGAIAGGLIGVAIYIFSGLAGWSLLVAAFGLASASSRFGLKRKVLLGIAEERGGRRSVGNAVANCGLATLAAILASASPYRDLSLLAMVAALAAAGSDTVASEVGKAWGRRTFLVIGFRRVQPGTSGAISGEGTAAGLVAALALAAIGQAGGLIPAAWIGIVVAGATVGSVVESALGATLEGPGILNNDLLNFINTAVAAIFAVALTGFGS